MKALSSSSPAPTPAVGLTSSHADDGALYVFAMTRTAFAWRRVDHGAATVRSAVQSVLCSIDSRTCPAGQGAVPTTYDLKSAYEIYRDTFLPVEGVLSGIRRIYVSDTGDLARIPLNLLVTAAPSTADLSATAWLADRFAVTVLPSVPSLGLAGRPVPAAQTLTYVGYGAPKLSGPAKREVRAAEVTGDWFISAPEAGVYVANPAFLRTLKPLERAEEELRLVAAALGANGSSTNVHIGVEDDEARFKADPQLGEARIIDIATHAILPRQADGPFEPGLVFTPPPKASLQNDGLLTPSKIVLLKLKADWVVLSACNTADVESGADHLSSLSTAFLFAGAKSLLASNWRVDDAATAELITRTMTNYAKGGGGVSRSQALQNAMTELRHKAGYEHPRYWAPFSLIADGDM
jgi:CHAT domain-containing protein